MAPPRGPPRPLARFFTSAAAAQVAGFRACKRCRPDAAPGSPEWDRRADVVGRAMRLIADGVVDREGVSGLAQRLGYTERHVDRELAAAVGAGPRALARAQRAQTARVLLETTAATISEVAFAAGFRSIRKFNATVKAARSPLGSSRSTWAATEGKPGGSCSHSSESAPGQPITSRCARSAIPMRSWPPTSASVTHSSGWGATAARPTRCGWRRGGGLIGPTRWRTCGDRSRQRRRTGPARSRPALPPSRWRASVLSPIPCASIIGCWVVGCSHHGSPASNKTTVIREVRSLDRVNESIADVEAGRVAARVVFQL